MSHLSGKLEHSIFNLEVNISNSSVKHQESPRSSNLMSETSRHQTHNPRWLLWAWRIKAAFIKLFLAMWSSLCVNKIPIATVSSGLSPLSALLCCTHRAFTDLYNNRQSINRFLHRVALMLISATHICDRLKQPHMTIRMSLLDRLQVFRAICNININNAMEIAMVSLFFARIAHTNQAQSHFSRQAHSHMFARKMQYFTVFTLLSPSKKSCEKAFWKQRAQD